MERVDIVIIAVIAAIIGMAAWYIYKAKKSGKKCIGCPNSDCCAAAKQGGCSGCSCGCGSTEDN